MRRYDLPKGRYVESYGPDAASPWVLYDGPGRCLYAGDRQGLIEALTRLGIIPEGATP